MRCSRGLGVMLAAVSGLLLPPAAARAQNPPPISLTPPQIPQPSGEPLTLESAFARAAAANPLRAAARLKRAINLASIDVARERPNPEAHVEVEKETPKQDVGIAVPIELGGKRSRRIAVAEAAVAAGEAELSQTIVEVRSQVRR